jgi:hypothetical protein
MVVQAVQVQSVGPGDRSMVHRHVREELWVIQRGEHCPSLARDELERPDQAVVEVQLKRGGRTTRTRSMCGMRFRRLMARVQ